MSKYKCRACGRYFNDPSSAKNHSCDGSSIGSFNSIVDSYSGIAIDITSESSSHSHNHSSDFGGGGHFGGGGSTDSFDSGSSYDSGSSDSGSCGSSD